MVFLKFPQIENGENSLKERCNVLISQYIDAEALETTAVVGCSDGHKRLTEN